MNAQRNNTQHDYRLRRAGLMVVLAVIATLIAMLAAHGIQAAAGMVLAPFRGSGDAAFTSADEAAGGPGVTSGETGEVDENRRPSVFDEQHPAVAHLDPQLLAAIQHAASDARAEGIEFFVNSGWRSVGLQERLIDDAIATYGSREEAQRWVAPAETSSHVSGHAVDIGDLEATSWLQREGAAYGLCQTYANEVWHFEFVPEAVAEGCPEPYRDPTYDPRL
ncbi:M15 family metallopeptidase [Leucobacter sp. UCMA 4100]|uniref:M15 family metallopeptidase n=1 Tax=Leucobacter sp. UCMA 4100 TaxID=2810534 RepID=UPI0022EA5634|nr:M15 family metallopeptidase [Leucobacter sp. UCMA 4100]MDA3147247.1 M15 family metallopeptidase [Leucobacter sp. UCMA 4100]